MEKKFGIKIFVMPVGACSYEKSWQYAVDLVSRKLKERLGDIFDIKLIELFSSESFAYNKIIEGIKHEKYQTPLVIIDGEIVQSGGKLSERKIREKLERR